MTDQYKVWSDFLINIEADSETDAEIKVEEVLDKIYEIDDNGWPGKYSVKATLERKIE